MKNYKDEKKGKTKVIAKNKKSDRTHGIRKVKNTKTKGSKKPPGNTNRIMPKTKGASVSRYVLKEYQKKKKNMYVRITNKTAFSL